MKFPTNHHLLALNENNEVEIGFYLLVQAAHSVNKKMVFAPVYYQQTTLFYFKRYFIIQLMEVEEHGVYLANSCITRL